LPSARAVRRHARGARSPVSCLHPLNPGQGIASGNLGTVRLLVPRRKRSEQTRFPRRFSLQFVGFAQLFIYSLKEQPTRRSQLHRHFGFPQLLEIPPGDGIGNHVPTRMVPHDDVLDMPMVPQHSGSGSGLP
jgi:hypothetical protein